MNTTNAAVDTPAVVTIIPAYNEERFIGSIVLAARQYTPTVIVVDDGSTDQTATIAEAAGAIVVRHERNRGKGVALNTGFRKARELRAPTVVTIDGDGQHMASELPAVLAPVLEGTADIVVGSRYLEPHSSVPRHRIWGHRAFNLLTNVTSGVSSTDSQSGFRAFSARAVEAITFSSKGFSVESEMQFLAQDLGLKLTEVPITIKYQDKPKRNVISHGLLVLNGVLQIIGQNRPLLYFGVPGLLVLLFGIGWGIRVVQIYIANQELAIGYALITAILIMTGGLSLFSGLILHSVRGMLLDMIVPKIVKPEDRVEN